MLESKEIKSTFQNLKDRVGEGPVQRHLRLIIDDYLSKHPSLTLNGLSQRCTVSEPTLRRICKGQIKTCPSPTTIIDILSYTGKTSRISELLNLYPGPATNLLTEKMSQLEQAKDTEYSDQLNQSLKDPVSYLIYKLAANDCGITEEKVLELFGNHGLRQAQSLNLKGLLINTEDTFKAKFKNFILSHDLFNSHFKAVSDFIKPHKLLASSKNYSPLFANYSSSVNRQAYASIVKIQRQAHNQMLKIITDKKNSGDIPIFILSAIDTLDSKSADEFPY